MPKSDKELAVELAAAILPRLAPDLNEITPDRVRELLATLHAAIRELPND